MRSVKLAAATLVIAALPLGSAMADTFWRNIISSGATTASTYLTFRHDHKLRESEINQEGKARKLWDIEEGKGI